MTQHVLDLVTAYQDAWTSGDLDAAATYLAPDFRFEGPARRSRRRRSSCRSSPGSQAGSAVAGGRSPPSATATRCS